MILHQENSDMLPVDILLAFNRFSQIGDIALLDIAANAEVKHFASGCKIKSDDYKNHEVYLINGEVEVVASDGKQLHRINSMDDRAQNPVFRVSTPGLVAVPTNKTSILVIELSVIERNKKKTIVDKINNQHGNYEYVSEGIVLEGGSVTVEEIFNHVEVGIENEILDEITQEFGGEQISLPSLPDVAIQINKVIQNPSIDFAVIADIVRAEPVITSRIIQVANSAMYTGQPKTESLTQAITRIGIKVTRSIVYSVVLKNLYRPKTDVTQKLMEQVYKDSIRTGIISQKLCKTIGILDSDQALLSGIIYNIGIIPILIMADKHESLADDSERLKNIAQELEPAVGGTLLSQWGFSEDIITVAHEHNNWFRDSINEPDYCDIVQAARLHSSFIGGEKINAPALHEISAFKRLGLGKIDHNDGIHLLKDAHTEIINMVELLLSA